MRSRDRPSCMSLDEEQTHATTCQSSKVGTRRRLLTFNLNWTGCETNFCGIDRNRLQRWWENARYICLTFIPSRNFYKNYLILRPRRWFSSCKSAGEINNFSFLACKTGHIYVYVCIIWFLSGYELLNKNSQKRFFFFFNYTWDKIIFRHKEM